MAWIGGYMEGATDGACHIALATGNTASLLDVWAQLDMELYTYLAENDYRSSLL